MAGKCSFKRIKSHYFDSEDNVNAAIKAWVHQNLIIAIFITITNIIVIIMIREMCVQLSMGPSGSDHQTRLWSLANQSFVCLRHKAIYMPKKCIFTRKLGAQILSGGPARLLTSSLAPFGRSGCVTHADNL